MGRATFNSICQILRGDFLLSTSFSSLLLLENWLTFPFKCSIFLTKYHNYSNTLEEINNRQERLPCLLNAPTAQVSRVTRLICITLLLSSITHPLPQHAATPFLPLSVLPVHLGQARGGVHQTAPEATSILGFQSPVDQDHG